MSRFGYALFRETDVDLVVSVAADPFIPLITTVPATGDREDALAYLTRQHERLSSGAGYSFAICEAATDLAVGQIGLWTHDLHHGRASRGYWVASRYRRRGYVVAALAAVSRWGFTLDEVARLELCAEPWNEGSWKAAERVGYQREGLLRSWQVVGGERRDMYMYSLLKTEFPRVRSGALYAAQRAVGQRSRSTVRSWMPARARAW